MAIDWIHNLVYYDFNEKLIVLNASQPILSYILFRGEKLRYVLEICVNPLDSLLFWSISQSVSPKTAIIMRASQDGSNQTVIVDKDLMDPSAMAIDLIPKRLYWIDRIAANLCSSDFDGKDLKTILLSQNLFTSTYYMTIFGDTVYWSTIYHGSLLRINKFGLNGTQLNILVKGEPGYEVESFKIIDSSLRPKSTNRCLNNRCSHLCLPASQDTYRCVCPQIGVTLLALSSQHCKESVSLTINLIPSLSLHTVPIDIRF